MGYWKEPGLAGAEAQKAGASMATRYSENKLNLAAVAKETCIEAVRMVTRAEDTFDIPWDKVIFPELSTIEQVTATAGIGIHRPDNKAQPSTSSGTTTIFPLKPSSAINTKKEILPLTGSQPSSGSSSSSSSDSEDPAQELRGHMVARFNDLKWAVPPWYHGRIHIVEKEEQGHLSTSQGCNRSLSNKAVQRTGILALLQVRNKWCPASWGSLDPQLREFLQGLE